MKKVIITVLVIVSCIAFASCSLVKRQVVSVLSQETYNTKLAESELTRSRSSVKIPFTRNYPDRLGCPVIRISVDGVELDMLVDTGCTVTWLYEGGISKMYGSLNSFFVNQGAVDYYREHLVSPEQSAKLSDDKVCKNLAELLKNYQISMTSDDETLGTLHLSNVKKYDGIIGMEYLQQYKRVTFDFINNYLILDDEPLSGSRIPMICDQARTCSIPFAYNGYTEYGLVDTGNYTFSPRNDFGKNDMDVSDIQFQAEYSLEFQGKIKKQPPRILSFNGIQIGGVTYDTIKGVYSNIWFSTYNTGAQQMLMKRNGLGCQFFRGHVIQFDFENSQFVLQ